MMEPKKCPKCKSDMTKNVNDATWEDYKKGVIVRWVCPACGCMIAETWPKG